MAKAGFRKAENDKGHRQIDNDTFEALMAAPLTGSEYKVILVVINQTWGFRKESEGIRLDKFRKLTGLTEQGIVKAINKVKSKEIITAEAPITKRGPKSTVTYALTDSNTWRVTKPQLCNSVDLVTKPQLESYTTTVERVTKLPTPEVVPVKKLIKDTIKEKDTSAKEDTNLKGIKGTSFKGNGPYPSGKSQATRGLTSLTDKDTENEPIPRSPLPFEGSPKSQEDSVESHPTAPQTKVKQVSVAPYRGKVAYKRIDPDKTTDWREKILGYEILDVLAILYYGQAEGRPASLKGDLETILENPDDDTLKAIKAWLDKVLKQRGES